MCQKLVKERDEQNDRFHEMLEESCKDLQEKLNNEKAKSAELLKQLEDAQ